MKRTWLRVLKWTVALAAIAGGIAFFLLRSEKDDKPITFKLGRVDRGTVEQTVTATGQLNAVVTVQVGSQVSGIIQKLGADFNTQVKAGQIIAQIEPTRFKANLSQAEAQLKNAQAAAARARVNHDQAKRELDRGRTLSEKQVIGESALDELRSRFELTQVELQSTEAQVAQARAQVGIARVDLERTIIKSPIDGTVLQRAVDVGQTVAASLQAPTLFTIAQDLSKMEVRAAIDEADVGKLKEGLEARFSVDAYPGREFVATIFQIRSNPTVAQNVVTYDAILRVDNPDGRLRPGMTANVRITTERRDNVLRISNAALRFKPPQELLLPMPERQRPDGGAPRGPGAAWAASGEGRGGPGPGAGAPGEGRRRGGGGWGGGPGGGGRREGGPRAFTRVYKAVGEKLQPVPFRAGIADDEYTEILGGPVKEGDEIVTEASGGSLQQAPSGPRPPMGGPGGGMRGGGMRGPRFM